MERCPYCFKPLPETGVCDCRYEESANARIEDALRPGTIVGAAYQIGAVLGKGGFGITYRAFDLNMESVVAIKEFYPDGMVIRAGLVNQASAGRYGRSEVLALTDRNQKTYRKSLDLFYREAVALGKLKRLPNVVHAYQFFRENGTAYIVMEFVEGRSLKNLIRDRGRIPENELLPLLDPILTALDRVHEAGILHRDIAPDNIMIENGIPVLIDFGAARVEEGHASSLLIGKKGYSSPEQMAGGEMDRRSDIYSLGATYYKALTGITPQESGMRGFNDQVVPPADLVNGISKNVSDTLMKAMAYDPKQRFDSVRDFQDALNREFSAGRKSSVPAETKSEAAVLPEPSPVKESKQAQTAEHGQTKERNSNQKAKAGWILLAILLTIAAAGIYFFRDRIIYEPTPTVDTAALTQTVLDATHTAEVSLSRTREAERAQQTETAVRTAEYASQTETAFYDQKEAELRQTATKSAENQQATQTYFESRTEEAGIRETQNELGTRQAAEATESAAVWLATQQAELSMTQTQDAADRRSTQTVIAQQTVWAEETATAMESTRQAEQRQTETKAAMDQQNTQTAAAQQTAWVEGTAAAAENTRQAEQRQTETKAAINQQNTQTAAAQLTAWAEETAAAVENTRQAEQRQTETKAAMDQQNTQTAAIQQTVQAEGTAAAAENTRQAEQQTETRAVMDQQRTQTVIARQTADAVSTADIIEQTHQAVNILQIQLAETQSAIAYMQTQQSMNIIQTQLGETQTAIGYMQTEAAQMSTQTAVAIEQTAFVQTQEAFSAKQTKAAEPTTTKTPQPTSANTATATRTPLPAPTSTPKPTLTSTPQPTLTSTPQPAIEPLKVGDMIKFGRYEQDNNRDNGKELIEWQVLAVEKDRILVISRYGLDAKPYNEKNESVTWETCSLRKWLNGEFYETAFSFEEKGYIQHVTNENPNNTRYSTRGGNRTNDSLFLLNENEFHHYRYETSDVDLECYATEYAKANGANAGYSGTSWWWLRTPGSIDSSASNINYNWCDLDGHIVTNDSGVVRPALWMEIAGETDAESEGGVVQLPGETSEPTGIDEPFSPQITEEAFMVTLIESGGSAYYYGPDVSHVMNQDTILRDSPSNSGAVLRSVLKNIGITLTNESKKEGNNTWVRVSTMENQTGWVPESAVSEAKWKLSEIPSSQLKTGDRFFYGTFEQNNSENDGPEPIEWLVLTAEENRALVISRYGLDAKLYNQTRTSVTWEASTLRKWLNGEFYETSFSSEEQEHIQQVMNENPDNPQYGTQGGSLTSDKIFLLSIDEAMQYFDSNVSRVCYATDYAKANRAYVDISKWGGSSASWWWLRSPGSHDYYAANVYYGGSVDIYGNYVDSDFQVDIYGNYVRNNRGVARPAFWLNL